MGYAEFAGDSCKRSPVIRNPQSFLFPLCEGLRGSWHRADSTCNIVRLQLESKNMTDKMRQRAIKSPRTAREESERCKAANAVVPRVPFWTQLEDRISLSEGEYERRMVKSAMLAAARRKDHVEP